MHQHFSTLLGETGTYDFDSWISFYREENPGKRIWCQPDAFWVCPDLNRITLIEVKLRHCAKAWFQLHQLYLPLLQHIYGTGYDYRTVEVVRWYDPDEPFPEHQLISEIRMAPKDKTGVHIWKP
jgi:hypothetical protein